MSRKMYQPTEKQEAKWATISPLPMPTDEDFQAMWKKAHHGKLAGWGMGKRDWIIANLKNSRDYQMGLWQGRVDKAQGLDYTEERIDAPYNLGYFRGYTEYELVGGNGWDREQLRAFRAEYQR